jgi:hypothetical protein
MPLAASRGSARATHLLHLSKPLCLALFWAPLTFFHIVYCENRFLWADLRLILVWVFALVATGAHLANLSLNQKTV